MKEKRKEGGREEEVKDREVIGRKKEMVREVYGAIAGR